MVITQADKYISNYYEVILNKLEKQKQNTKPALSANEMENIYKIAEQIDRMDKQAKDERLEWREEDLIDLFGKKTIH